jgi:hypothetical protein
MQRRRVTDCCKPKETYLALLPQSLESWHHVIEHLLNAERFPAAARAAFSERMRDLVYRLRLDRTCASTAGICASAHSAAAARFQSIQSQYCASTALHAHHADNTRHNTLQHQSPFQVLRLDPL